MKKRKKQRNKPGLFWALLDAYLLVFIAVMLALFATGCHSPLLPGHEAPAPRSGERVEPYAVFDYYNGTDKYYFVHWKGNAADGVSFPERYIDRLFLPKFDN